MMDRADNGGAHPLGRARWNRVVTGAHTTRAEAAWQLRSPVAAIVLAGSYRRAFDPVSRFLRDPLLPVAQLPVISYPLTWLLQSRHEVRDIVVCAHDATNSVRRYFGESGGGGRTRLQYYAEDHPRGPAGCARDAAGLTSAGTFVVVEGSLLPSLDLDALLIAHAKSGAVATTVVELDRRTKDATSARLPGGIYVFEREALDLIAPRGFQDIKQGLFERLHGAGSAVHVHEIAGVSPRIVDFTSYSAASRWLIEGATRQGVTRYPGFVSVGEGLHHASARIGSRATFVGPVLVGPDAMIGDDAVIVGPTAIGAGAEIRERAIVARSVLLEESIVGTGAYVDASLLAPYTRIAANARVVRQVMLADDTATELGRPARRTSSTRGSGSDEHAPILSRVASRK